MQERQRARTPASTAIPSAGCGGKPRLRCCIPPRRRFLPEAAGAVPCRRRRIASANSVRRSKAAAPGCRADQGGEGSGWFEQSVLQPRPIAVRRWPPRTRKGVRAGQLWACSARPRAPARPRRPDTARTGCCRSPPAERERWVRPLQSGRLLGVVGPCPAAARTPRPTAAWTRRCPGRSAGPAAGWCRSRRRGCRQAWPDRGCRTIAKATSNSGVLHGPDRNAELPEQRHPGRYSSASDRDRRFDWSWAPVSAVSSSALGAASRLLLT